MRLVIQRVSEAKVTVGGKEINQIGFGLMILVGIEKGDNEEEMDWLISKTINMRIFPDEEGVMNKSVREIGGDIMAVSQFTLTASTKKGNRPSYIRAENPEIAKEKYEEFCRKMSEILGKEVKKGIFGADMKVSIVNEGPVTIVIDSRLKE